jgi:hypothetical protein
MSPGRSGPRGWARPVRPHRSQSGWSRPRWPSGRSAEPSTREVDPSFWGDQARDRPDRSESSAAATVAVCAVPDRSSVTDHSEPGRRSGGGGGTVRVRTPQWLTELVAAVPLCDVGSIPGGALYFWNQGAYDEVKAIADATDLPESWQPYQEYCRLLLRPPVWSGHSAAR